MTSPNKIVASTDRAARPISDAKDNRKREVLASPYRAAAGDGEASEVVCRLPACVLLPITCKLFRLQHSPVQARVVSEDFVIVTTSPPPGKEQVRAFDAARAVARRETREGCNLMVP